MRKSVPRAFGTRGTSTIPPKAAAMSHSVPWSIAIKEHLSSSDRTAMVGFLIKAGVALWVLTIVLVVFFG